MLDSRTPNRFVAAGTRIICIIAWGCLLASGPAQADAFDAPRVAANPLPELSKSDQDALAELDRLSRAFSLIAEAVKPSVVSIKASAVNEAVNEELKRLFGDQAFQPIPTTGTGSGIIFDEEGHIVTNHHVVADADVVRVTLADGREFRAEVVGTDAMTDIAVIKIDADRLHPARFGDSDAANVGHIVLTIGSPFKFGHSVSHGIISAVGRSEVDVDIAYKNWLQTDAPINPGNSGGPLINTHGEVIGISVAIATESGGHQGVGFAIPANTVVRIAEQLKSGKKVVRGLLGVVIQAVDNKTANAYGLSEAHGALINDIGEKTPAEKGGLQVEDIILAYNGKQVGSHDNLREIIAETRPGTEVTLSIWRKGAPSNVKVTIGEQPPNFDPAGSIRELNQHERLPAREDRRELADTSDNPDEKAVDFEELGFEVHTINRGLAKRYHVDRNVKSGALITNVDPTGEAYAANLRAGHVIVRANDQPIRNREELEKILTDDAVAKGVRVKVLAGNREFLAVLRTR